MSTNKEADRWMESQEPDCFVGIRGFVDDRTFSLKEVNDIHAREVLDSEHGQSRIGKRNQLDVNISGGGVTAHWPKEKVNPVS